MTDPAIPDIGKYRILELVGEGAMGVVYKAVDTVLNRTVAIKVMNDAIARQEDLRSRFLREAQAAASLQHPNVVSIYDLGEVDGHLYIAMEFVQGADLEELMKSGTPLSLQQKLDIAIDVLSGLSFTHKRGIVHRDIKPANIRIGEDGRAKLMDFGVAHLASSNLTSTGASLGTPVYMSPEQITGGKATPATDVFAVGAVLYELLTGAKPFEAPTLQALFFKILTDKPKPVRELVPDLPSALDHVVEKAMAKDAPKRYQSALEMANDLSGVRSAIEGSSSYPSSVSLSATVEHAIRRSRQATRTRTRKREIAVGGGVLVTAALAALVWTQARHGGAARAAFDSAAIAGAAPSVAASSGSTPADSPPAAPSHANAGTQPVRPTPSDPQASGLRAESPRTGTVAAPAPPPATPRREPTRSVAAPAPRSATPERTPPATPPRTVAEAPAQLTSPEPASGRPVPSAEPTIQQGTATSRTLAAPAPVTPPQSAPPSGPPSAPVAAPATAADVAPVIEAYARAIESRDLGAVRRVYPGITGDQQRGFEQFFESARRIDVTFRVTSVEGTATTAEARVTGAYQYERSAGRMERQPVNFQVSLRREGGSWRLVSVR